MAPKTNTNIKQKTDHEKRHYFITAHLKKQGQYLALAGLLALGVALLTVSWQSLKVATRNPVEALRHE